MQILEFGNKNNKKIMFIHGFLSIWQIWEEYIEYYKNDFHIIVPILPTHSPDKREDFISFSKTAKELEDYYIDKYGESLYAVYGMSMGGILATKLLENKRLKINKIILDSSPLASYNKLIQFILTKSYLLATHSVQKRNNKTIFAAKNLLYTDNHCNDFLKMLDNISDETIINFIKAMKNYKLPNNIDISNIEIHYLYGTKLSELLSKKTAKYIKKYYPVVGIQCFKGRGHCEGFCTNPDFRIKILNNILF